MKRIAVIVMMVLMGLGASARSIHYFTYSQAARTVNYLNTQNELMIYCGYDYEIETYVLINEIWMERVNSSFYEIWVYGYDAYTGEEIYMPLDLQCIWLYSAGRMYNAAQYLRFSVDPRVPSFVWSVPVYSPFTRIVHRPGYARTYHYDIHRHGWMPPAYTHTPGGRPPLPYYYMRRPGTPTPMPTNTWTPGVNRPEVTPPAQPYHIGNTTSATNPSANNSSHNTSTTRNSNTRGTSSSSQNSSTTPTRNGSATPTRNSSSSSSSSETPTRNGSATPTRNSSTSSNSSATPTRNSSATPTRNSSTSSNSSATPTRNSSATPTRNSSTSSNSSATPSRNSSATPTRNSSSSSNTSATPSRNSSDTPSRNSSTTRNSGNRNNSSTTPTRNR